MGNYRSPFANLAYHSMPVDINAAMMLYGSSKDELAWEGWDDYVDKKGKTWTRPIDWRDRVKKHFIAQVYCNLVWHKRFCFLHPIDLEIDVASRKKMQLTVVVDGENIGSFLIDRGFLKGTENSKSNRSSICRKIGLILLEFVYSGAGGRKKFHCENP